MNLSLMDALMGLLVLQSLFLALWLLSRRQMPPLALWLLVLAAHMGANLAEDADLWQGLTPALGLLHGPLMWLWVRHLVRAQRLGLHAAWHALPAVAVGLLVPQALRGSLWPLAALQFGAYWLAAAWLLWRQHREAAQLRAHAGAELRWLQGVLAVLLAIALLDFARLPLRGWPGAPLLQAASLAGLLACLYALLWQGLRQPLRISALQAEELQALDETPTPVAEQEIQRWQQQLARWQSERPFLDPELSLLGLAAQWGDNPRQLSQRIQHLGNAANFREFVNRARVEWVCAELAAGRRDKLLSLQLEAGFNSKSVFNEAFKRHAGVSPSAYREKVQGPET